MLCKYVSAGVFLQKTDEVKQEQETFASLEQDDCDDPTYDAPTQVYLVTPAHGDLASEGVSECCMF